MSINNNLINVGANIDSDLNIKSILFNNFEESGRVDIIITLTEEEVNELKIQNSDYNSIFTELTNKYKTDILSKLKNNEEKEEGEISEQVTSFFDKIRKILSKNDIPRSLSTSES
ncbi:MAG: hypothetical protein Q8K30_01525 [Candidatus Gracilibacteria bacterium]|nr:hypothetical protein [Candidatus Gracilibacteria bacterium]